ncbi:MurR/RpiR family transcriptional regulator [Enterobacillus tribolii]|uniref:RpiR family transcriptional regulator n=1 Tax=Enterobacillus tribolii TaxID=1487935 RepID=A0A370QHI8_9GAMM|nr:MurR/RpiR family transcriptional regulator [Enterobacillus tribolii]MBW7982544.1 MurR/RpiR family transcriptional regulator [Enterobacillus tribolii]RDK87824.1 RpiR family transcriptional regulator [Enterobacillus tribolii]
MFNHASIANLNGLEMMVYNYVIKNREKVMYMTIRELADAAQVSTTTVLRFCKKMNCDGYSEFRIRFKLYLEQEIQQPAYSGVSEIVSFFKSINNSEFDDLIDQAVRHIAGMERIIFVGAGTSGTLGKYGARFFSNVGKFSNYIDDPYYPISSDMYKNAVAIILSVSGETPEILKLASQFSLHHCKIVSITSNDVSSLAKMADFNLSYHMAQTLIQGEYNVTTQVPVVYILEVIGNKLARYCGEK